VECGQKHPCRAGNSRSGIIAFTNTWVQHQQRDQYPSENYCSFSRNQPALSHVAVTKRDTQRALRGKTQGVQRAVGLNPLFGPPDYTKIGLKCLFQSVVLNAILALLALICAAKAASHRHTGRQSRRAEPWRFGSRLSTFKVRQFRQICCDCQTILANTVSPCQRAAATNWDLTLVNGPITTANHSRAFDLASGTGFLGQTLSASSTHQFFSFLIRLKRRKYAGRQVAFTTVTINCLRMTAFSSVGKSSAGRRSDGTARAIRRKNTLLFRPSARIRGFAH